MIYENLKNMFINDNSFENKNELEQSITDYLMDMEFEQLQEVAETDNRIKVVEDGNPREDFVIAIKKVLIDDYEKENFEYIKYSDFAEKYVGNMVMLNNITNVEPELEIHFNKEAYFEEYGDDYEDKDESDLEIYQYFALDIDEERVEDLLKQFPTAIFAYSEKLDIFLLCVDHFGSSWRIVDIKKRKNIF